MKKALLSLAIIFCTRVTFAQTNINKLPTYEGSLTSATFTVIYVNGKTYKIPVASLVSAAPAADAISYFTALNDSTLILALASGKTYQCKLPVNQIKAVWPITGQGKSIGINQTFLDSLLKQ